MLVDLCSRYIDKKDGLVNGADGIFKTTSTYQNEDIMWILFPLQTIGTQARKNNKDAYTINSLRHFGFKQLIISLEISIEVPL